MNKAEIITLRVTADEKDQLKAAARKYRTSVSDLVRGMVIDERIPDPSGSLAIDALYTANADLARLGNLLKLGIDQGTFTAQRVDALLTDIRSSQKTVLNTAQEFGGRTLRRTKHPFNPERP